MDAYLAFVDLDTCWRRTRIPVNQPAGTVQIADWWDGLLPEGVREVLHAHGHRGRRYREVWADIKIMERAALLELNKSD